ncbi:MAG: hypothetical protein U0795_20130 [Pirellulales bacterium]
MAEQMATPANAFGRISVAGQPDVVADSPGATANLAEGANVTITTDAGTGTVTIAADAGGSLQVTAAAHGLTAADVGKPIVLTSTGLAVWDDVNFANFPSGLLAERIDADQVKLALTGATIVLADTLLEGTNLAVNGRWFYWDKSQNAGAGRWMYELPDDSYFDVPLIEVVSIGGGSVTAIVHGA